MFSLESDDSRFSYYCSWTPSHGHSAEELDVDEDETEEGYENEAAEEK